MQPERLHARIRHQIALASPDLEARALATELAEMGARARERLEQCATLLRLGNEQAALQAAETEPSLPELCAWISFAESEEWARLCQKHGLPVTPAPDDSQVLAIELLYGRPIDENHPLYRDYRQAIRERDEGRALAVLRSITSVNPSDANARAELDRLRGKFMRESLAKARALFEQGDASAASQLMDRMEQLGTASLSGETAWDDALRRRAEWVGQQARRRINSHAERAAAARAANAWPAGADEGGAARTLERNAGVRAEPPAAESLASSESWAAEHVASAAAEHAARSEAEALRIGWNQLSTEATRSESADLLRRINHWLERAVASGGRVDAENVAAAERLSRALHQRLVRRHTLRTAASVAVVIVALLAGHLIYLSVRARSTLDEAIRSAEVQLEAWDGAGMERALAAAEPLANTTDLREELDRRAATLRETLKAHSAREQALATEAAFLAEVRSSGIDATNFAETRRRAKELEAQLGKVGGAAAARIRRKSGDLADLVARCEKVAGGLRSEVESLARELEAAVGNGERLANPDEAERTAVRIRDMLASPGATLAVGTETGDRALALAERVEQRITLERAKAVALRKLDAATDLKAYLAGMAALAGDPLESPEKSAAAAILDNAPLLGQLPRSLLGPRAGAMWDAAATPEPPAFSLNPEEAALAADLTEHSSVRNLRKFIIREHTSPAPGVSESRVREAEYVVGDLSAENRRIQDGNETLFTARVLRSTGDTVTQQWSLRTFNNGVISGKEPTEGLPLPEVEYFKRFTRFFTINAGHLAEPPIRTLERVRRETGAPILRAYQLQELYRLASIRPAESGLAFSPSAQRDAAELRGITQNKLGPVEFIFGNDAALKTEITKFHARSDVAYVAEAQYLRAVLVALRQGGATLVGRVGLDGKPSLRAPVAPGTPLLGIDTEGRPAVLFVCGSDGQPEPTVGAAPLSPLLRLITTPAAAAETAGARPAGVKIPAGGWNSLLTGQDL
ncbi:MAG: hypothetical protein ACO23N_03675 [Opitutales bacterium]